MRGIPHFRIPVEGGGQVRTGAGGADRKSKLATEPLSEEAYLKQIRSFFTTK